MHGLLLIDKPEGISSFDVVRRVRRICRTRKVGHGGTLDPLATGLLPVAVGHATRLLEFLLEGNKTYRATLRLGITTSTQDSQGDVLRELPWDGLDAQRVADELQRFVGEQLQLPPMYSALKHQGQPLYRLARSGTEVERAPRHIEIFRISLIRTELPEVCFDVECSKGTYVRTLIHDLGERLGVGAHMTALRRLVTGPYRLEQAVSLAELEAHDWSRQPGCGWLNLLQSAACFPQLMLTHDAVNRVANGIPPTLDQASGADQLAGGETVALVSEQRLLAVATYDPRGELDARGNFLLLKVFPAS